MLLRTDAVAGAAFVSRGVTWFLMPAFWGFRGDDVGPSLALRAARVLLVSSTCCRALRYQLNYTCYALAIAQYVYTPAFTGYLTEAQANTIEKMRDKRV